VPDQSTIEALARLLERVGQAESWTDARAACRSAARNLRELLDEMPAGTSKAAPTWGTRMSYGQPVEGSGSSRSCGRPGPAPSRGSILRKPRRGQLRNWCRAQRPERVVDGTKKRARHTLAPVVRLGLQASAGPTQPAPALGQRLAPVQVQAAALRIVPKKRGEFRGRARGPNAGLGASRGCNAESIPGCSLAGQRGLLPPSRRRATSPPGVVRSPVPEGDARGATSPGG
jgi:hypothetical protein